MSTAPSSGRGRWLSYPLSAAAYAVPAAIAWMGVGTILRPIASYPLLLAVPGILYALCHGRNETLGLPRRPPGSIWQVPASWIAGRSQPARALIWGALLGPGFVTRNPYAGMWLMPVLVGLSQSLAIAGGVGGAHGLARALGILHNCRLACDPARAASWEPYQRWRRYDGMLLLLGAGAIAAYCFVLPWAH